MKNEIYNTVIAGLELAIYQQDRVAPHHAPTFAIRYGTHTEANLLREDAARAFGCCVFHSLEASGRLDKAPAAPLGEQPITDAELASFLLALNIKRKEAHLVNYASSEANPKHPLNYDNFEKIEAEVGPKFIKLSTTTTEKPHSTARALPSGRYVRSCYCFLVRANGDILKAASRKAPAKGVRGNIRKTWWGVALSQYGAVYLR